MVIKCVVLVWKHAIDRQPCCLLQSCRCCRGPTACRGPMGKWSSREGRSNPICVLAVLSLLKTHWNCPGGLHVTIAAGGYLKPPPPQKAGGTDAVCLLLSSYRRWAPPSHLCCSSLWKWLFPWGCGRVQPWVCMGCSPSSSYELKLHSGATERLCPSETPACTEPSQGCHSSSSVNPCNTLPQISGANVVLSKLWSRKEIWELRQPLQGEEMWYLTLMSMGTEDRPWGRENAVSNLGTNTGTAGSQVQDTKRNLLLWPLCSPSDSLFLPGWCTLCSSRSMLWWAQGCRAPRGKAE